MNGTPFKLGTFAKRADPPFVGIVLGNNVIELTAAHAAYRASPHRGTLSETGSILAVLENWDAMLGKFSGDAPLCSTCGHITIRNGACYKCMNCGATMGCS